MDLAEKGEIGLDGAVRRAHRRLPGLHGVRDGVPVGRAVRPAAGGGAPADRAQRRARHGRPAVPRRDLRAVPVPAPAARRRRARCALPARCGRSRRSRALAERLPGRLARDGVAAAAGLGARRVRPPARAHPRGRAPGAAGSRCCPAACRTCSSTGSTRPPCGCSPPRAATSSCPRDQQCCGALELHAGREEPALAPGAAHDRHVRGAGRRRRSSPTWPGCGSSMKEYGHLLADDPEWAERAAAFSARVRDVHEVLAEREPPAPRHPVAGPGRLPRRLPPRARPGGARRSRGRCCARSRAWSWSTCPRRSCAAGRPGIYNLVEPEAAAELGARKAGQRRARRARTSSSPPTRAACCRSASTSAPDACRCCTRSSCSTPASAGCRCPAPDRVRLDRVTARTGSRMSGIGRSAAYQQNPEAVGGSLGLSALVSVLPLAVVLVLLGVLRVRAQWAALAGLADRVAGRDRRVRHAGRDGVAGRARTARSSACSRSCGSWSTPCGCST